VVQLLQKEGARVVYHDPYIAKVVPGHEHDLHMESVPLTDAELQKHDAVIVLTDHTAIDYANVVRQARLVIDTRNATRAVHEGREKVVKA
jgi:UDP-N-acetyl-D-glucosamine dehydrogenase